MSSVTLASKNSVFQGFSSPITPSINPSGARLSRRGRLARTLFVASLTVVLVAGFAAKSAGGEQVVAATSYVTVVVPGGATLWSVASAYSTGDVQAMVEAIREANGLSGYDVTAGQKLRIPNK
jgi:hypothetical protein